MRKEFKDVADPWISTKVYPDDIVYGEDNYTSFLHYLKNDGANVWVNCASFDSCISCDIGCLSCSGTSSNCQHCDTSANYYLSGTRCLLCNTKGPYYHNGATCLPC